MTALTLALFALAANPLPDNKTPIDSLTYSFGLGGALGAGGSLNISKDGKVSYHYSSAPFTGSGGRVVQKTWDLSKEERTDLFRKLVDDGLLEAEEGGTFLDGIRITSGRWHATLDPAKVPEKAMAHLRPLLGKADPVLWPEKKKEEKAPVVQHGKLTTFIYYHVPKKGGDYISFVVKRDGKVVYARRPPNAAKPVEAEWTIPAKDAEALLDALVADGVLDLEDVGRDKFPSHALDVQVGRWRTSFGIKELPEKFSKQLMPLLKKADAEFWK